MPFVAPQDRCIRVSCGRPEDLALFARALPEASGDAHKPIILTKLSLICVRIFAMKHGDLKKAPNYTTAALVMGVVNLFWMSAP